MKDLEERFGKPHPALEGFKEPPAEFDWLTQAFFRLHRRRQHADFGFQPITVHDMTHFAESVLRLDWSLRPLFFRCMECVDNAVIHDQYQRAQSKQEASENSKKPQPRRR